MLFSIADQRVQYIENATELVDISVLQAGVCFMRITTKNGFAIKKIVKQ